VTDNEQKLTTKDIATSATAPTGQRAESSSDAKAAAQEEDPALLDREDAGPFRARWQEVQVRFVDQPRDSVQRADELVAEVMQSLAETFSDERSALESRWSSGNDASTEDLRIALQRYRSFFNRLLSA